MMHLQKKPNAWSCSITAFAMAMGVRVEAVVGLLGHDGSEVIFPELPDPMCRRGFHHQELIMLALCNDKTVTPFELIPAHQSTPYPGHTPSIYPIEGRKPMFELLLRTRRGFLTGKGSRCQHAVAFDSGMIYDPDGAIYHFSFEECERRRFITQCAWIVADVSNN